MKGLSTPHRILMNLKGEKDKARAGDGLGATQRCLRDGVLGDPFICCLMETGDGFPCGSSDTKDIDVLETPEVPENDHMQGPA